MPDTRRYDLDWLRVFVFLLLIFYHVGMFYVPWGWHVKSVHAPVDWLRLPMAFTNPWRLPILFFVSGLAIAFAVAKAPNIGRFAANRFYRLFVPLVFGMVVIVAPQSYYELVQNGAWNNGPWAFYGHYLAPWLQSPPWPIITPTWNHLWYLLYILVLTMVLVAIESLSHRRFGHILTWGLEKSMGHSLITLGVFGPVVILLITHFTRDSVGHMQTLVGDWHRLALSGFYVLLGFGTAKSTSFWSETRRHRGLLLGLAGAFQVLNLLDVVGYAGLGPAWSYVIRLGTGWFSVLAILAWVQCFNLGPSKALSYLTGAVFSYYVLHQTLIVMIGAPLTTLALPFGVEITVIATATLAGCAVFYHVGVRNMGPFAVLVGGRG